MLRFQTPGEAKIMHLNFWKLLIPFDISSISHCDFSFGIEHVNALCLTYHNFLANAADVTN